MEEKDIAIQISGLKKRYRLGTIGGGTLVGDLQSWWARIHHREDPNSKIGSKIYGKNETFMALDGIDLTVYKGEKIGIIGHNGAGKSTLLKLLSRVTGPTEGEIKIDGRISSMLEVGTGFNGELTGRENIYLNGAILGMTKKEVDDKIEDIIEFSEVRQFIDTPVKRYSSGMYVKLAFSVAAHLDSEILIMDEVLAVGDVVFQQKCLKKMSQVSQEEGRTILYVSHNMNTIRQLCDRVIVLDHGKSVFDGEVEEGISKYSSANQIGTPRRKIRDHNDLSDKDIAKIVEIYYINKENCDFEVNDKMNLGLKIISKKQIEDAAFRIIVKALDGMAIGVAFSDIFILEQGVHDYKFQFNMSGITPGGYKFDIVLSKSIREIKFDINYNAMYFYIGKGETWQRYWWGSHQYPNMVKLDN